MKRPINELLQDIVFSDTLRGHRLTFHSTWGLFSPEAIDPGSRLLLEHLTVRPDDTIIDVGCGYGAIGIAAAVDAPQGAVHLVDNNFVAVEYAKKNLAANHLANGRAYLSNGLRQVPDGQKFTLIISNLPAKVGRELHDIWFDDAKHLLRPGGRFVVVTIAGLKEYIKTSFKEVFGNYDKIKQSGTHIVAQAVKE